MLHLLIVTSLAMVTLIPVYRILQRTGFSGWWCLLSLIPAVGFILLWYFAYAEWPALDNNSPGPFGRMRPEM
jgi:uncharacterized membrane protein YhaH (DUF805 family)